MMNTLVRRNSSRSRSTKIYSMTIFTIALVLGIIQPTNSLSVTSTYPGTLTVASPAFVRPTGYQDSYYFYQALQFNASVAGQYSFKSSSISYMDTFGCLYQISFDPSNSNNNLVIYDDDSGGQHQFLFTSTLQTEQTYILVVTTTPTSTIGDYTAIVDGPGSVVMTPLLPVISNFNGTLSTSSTNFTRPYGYTYNYYYQAMRITNYKRGVYTFRSESTLNSYGFLYNGSVNPNEPMNNLVASDDSTAGNQQFLIGYLLETDVKYTLVYSTQDDNVTGDFRIISTGPSSVTFVPYTPTPPFDMINIYGIAYSCFVAGVVLLSILTRKRQKK